MSQRLQPRVRAVMPVRISGTDTSGNKFDQLAHTTDISPAGARIAGLAAGVNVGDTVSLQYKNRKAEFRVVWVGAPGTPRANQMGLATLGSESRFWTEIPAEAIKGYVDYYKGREAAAQAAVKAAAEQWKKESPFPAAVTPQKKEEKEETISWEVSETMSSTEVPQTNQSVAFRLENITNELLEVRQLLPQEEDIAPEILQAFREALDEARHTSWNVRQWIELKQGSGEYPLMTLVSNERLRVATELCNKLVECLGNTDVQLEPVKVHTFMESAQALFLELMMSQEVLQPSNADSSTIANESASSDR